MAVNAFITFYDTAKGESVQKGKEQWIEIQGWDWEIEAESSWTKGGGASVGKANPGKMNFEHYFDTSSTVIMGYICSGKAFPKMMLEMMKTTGKGTPETYFSMFMEGAYITKVSNSGTEEGNVTQKVEMVFKHVTITYQPQDNKNGQLLAKRTYDWDISLNTSSSGGG